MMIKKIIMTILISILIIFSSILLLYFSASSKKNILKELDKMDYYSYTYNDIINKLELELPNKGLSYVYDKYLTKDKIKSDVITILNSSSSREKIKNEFYEIVLKNFGNKDDENIKELSKTLSNTYYNNLFRIDKLNIFLTKLTLKNNLKFIGFFSIFVLIFLIISFIKEIYIYNAFIVSGVLLMLPRKFAYLFENIYYYNNNLSYFIRNYCYNIINICFDISLVLIVIGLISFCFKIVIAKRQLTKNVE